MERIRFMLVLLAIGAGVSFAGIMDTAAIYLPFEGVDTGINSQPWQNQGTAGTGESPFSVGAAAAPTPTVTAAGARGQAADFSMMNNMATGNTYQWGSNDLNFTDMERSLLNTWSFTFSAWIRTDALYDQARVFSSVPFEINHRNDWLSVRMKRPSEGVWFNSDQDAKNFNAVGDWLFLAVTYDGTKSSDNLVFYYGDENTAVAIDSVHTADFGRLVRDGSGAPMRLGNAGVQSNRPFKGFIDELAIWSNGPGDGDVPDSTGSLSVADIELVRLATIPEPATLALLALGMCGLRRRRR